MNNRWLYACCLLATLALLSACDKSAKHAPGPPLYMLYSPNGEPLNGGLLGRPDCKKALTGWFNRMAGASGIITQPQFLADAEQQFKRMDIDRNGYLVSEELDRFRAPYRQQPEGLADAENKKHAKGTHGKDNHSNEDKSSENSITSNLFDPVMSADANLDFRVTYEEFMHQAHDVFARLDTDHSGAITLPEALATCPAQK